MHPCLAALLSALSDAREVVLTPEPARVLALVAALNVENLFSAVTLHAEHDMPAVSADIPVSYTHLTLPTIYSV